MGAAADTNSAEKIMEHNVEAEQTVSVISGFIQEILYNPMNLVLVIIIAFLVYKIIKDRLDVYKMNRGLPAAVGRNAAGTAAATGDAAAAAAAAGNAELPRIKRDFTVAELRDFDGTKGDGRILVAVNGSVFDVTKGKHFYGPEGPYASFAGRDASRNLATFSVTVNNNDNYDDLSDLNAVEMESVREWEMQFRERYYYVGKLLRNKEKPTNYEEEEEDTDRESKTDIGPMAEENATQDSSDENTTVRLRTSVPLAAAQQQQANLR